MRIVASNPDGIGDLVLRQPLYAALQAAGHELLLLIRPHALGLPEVMARGAAFALIPGNPYTPEMLAATNTLDEVLARIAEFRPDMYLIAPFQWTPFEERSVPRLPAGTRVVGMTGRMFSGDLRGGFEWRSTIRFDAQAPVAEDEPELTKNARLAALILGRGDELQPPALSLLPAHTVLAEEMLRRNGLQRDGFVVACVGDHEFSAVRNWSHEKWAAVLTHWVRKYNRSVAFVGIAAERAAVEHIRALMGDAASATVSLLEDDPPLAALLGITAAARAYIGKDTGPMHIAAALGKPVIAVFGGGHWPRFVPAPRVGHVATVGVPCVGCDWVCPFAESYCIKHVPEAEVRDAIDALEAQQMSAAAVRVLPVLPTLQAEMVRTMRTELQQAQRRMYRAEREAREFAALRAEFGPEAAARLRKAEELLAARSNELARARLALDEAQSREAALRAQLATARAAAIAAQVERHDVGVELRQVQAAQEQLSRAVHQQTVDCGALREHVTQQERQTAQYRQYVQDLRQSRWRQLGLRIGMAKRAAWEPGDEPV